MADSNDNKNTNSQEVCLPRRYLLTFVSCIGLIAVNSMRVNLGITMVTLSDENVKTEAIMMNNLHSNETHLDWSPPMVGFLHSAFYIGFLITQVPGGYICKVFPGTRIFGLSIVISCALNFLLPVSLTSFGYVFTCSLRLVQGLVEGVTQPALYAFIREWSPRSEKSSLAAACLSGVYAGPIIGFPLDGAVTNYVGWQYTYYIHGLAGILWFFVWFLIAYEAPEVDPYISKKELGYILSDRDPAMSMGSGKTVKVPWGEILTSAPVWSLAVCHFILSWMFFLMLTNEPMYLNQFHFTIFENGIFSAIPHVFKVVTTFCGGLLADCMIQSQQISRTNTRKVFTGLGFGIESVCVYCLVFIDHGYLAVIFLTLGIGFSGLAVSGWQVNHLDLAPDYASVLVGFSATIGTLGGILSPIVAGIMTDPPTLQNWQNTFILTATLLMVAAVTFTMFGSGEIQPWANSQENLSLVNKEISKYTDEKENNSLKPNADSDELTD